MTEDVISVGSAETVTVYMTQSFMQHGSADINHIIILFSNFVGNIVRLRSDLFSEP